MKTRVGHVDGHAVPLLISSVIPGEFVHGFTTRQGGISAPPFDSFNLGMKWGDARENVLENRRRLLALSGATRMHLVPQVHGTTVVTVDPLDDPAHTATLQADALICRAPHTAVAIFVADCVPVLLADPVSGACAAVHAGWRGVVGGVATATVAALGEQFGARPGDLRVALGPSIGSCCFEVGPEVVTAFASLLPEATQRGVILPRQGGKPHVHLRRALRLRLEEAGIPAGQIEEGEECTRCDPQGRFFSYRRDAGQTGQHLAFITGRSRT